VAVITTCFNQEDLIGGCIESVVRQDTSATVYHVVCDDGSEDGSLGVLRGYEAELPNLRVLSVTNRGMAAAFNACMMALPAAAEFVVLIGGDDWLSDNFITECLRALTPGTDMVVPAMRRVDYPGHLHNQREMPLQRNPTFEEVWAWEMTWAWGVSFYRREVIVEAGGWHPHVGGDCDWDMWIDLTRRGHRFAYAPDACFFYRRVPTSMNRTKTREQWDAARAEMKRHFRMDTMPGPEFS
jgi:glycosyltransferase involved in cell wall biosynthesis